MDDDAALMAELLAISNQSASSRFDNKEEEEGNDNDLPQKKTKKPSPKKMGTPNRNGRATPPWKRKSSSSAKKTESTSDNIESLDNNSNKAEVQSEPTKEEVSMSPPAFGGFNNTSKLTNTFKGERGGVADDEDLLAELRAISMKNKSADRFGNDDEDDPMAPPVARTTPAEKPWKKKQSTTSKKAASPKKTPVGKRGGDDVSPWKRKGSAKKNVDPFENASVEDSPVKEYSKAREEEEEEESMSPPVFGGFNNTNNLQNTFKGERGGVADDEDLLAELRAISMKNKSADRFGNDDEEDPMAPPVARSTPAEKPWKKKQSTTSKKAASPKKTPVGKRGGDDVSPWKRKGSAKKNVDPFENASVEDYSPVKEYSKAREEEEEESMSPPAFGGFNNTNNLQNTFKGERGGVADDEDLLAELRAISMKNKSADRFGGGDEYDDDSLPAPPPMPVRPKKKSSPKKAIAARNPPPGRSNDAPPPPWKKKGPTASPIKSKTAPSLGRQPLTQACPTAIKIELPPKGSALTGPIDDILVTEENVAEYIDSKNWKLRKASYDVIEEVLDKKTKGRVPVNDMPGSEIHECISDSLIPRMAKDSNASALDSALRFVFGYIDYCSKGCDPSLVSSLVTSIVTGPALSATRPSTSKIVDAVLMKVMQVSRNEPSSIHIVVEHLLDHGITSKKPKVVLKSTGMILDAAKSFGAATLPLAKVTASAEKMLSNTNGDVRDNGINILAEICRVVGSKDPLAEIVQSMKTAQVSELDALLSSQPNAISPLIGLRYAETLSSSTNALELLQAGANENAAAKFAAREPVNIFNDLRETEYKSRMKAVKWSEKVGALDILLHCGGEQPYKLAQPSSSINYNALIAEMKKLLSHTHFAVKTKALLVLGMLAEGVGEKLFSHMRPLLAGLLELSKDKKVATATETCLDRFFDNIVGFSHLLDKDDGLATWMNEKKQKNVIVRKATLSFLERCVKQSRHAKARGFLDEDTARKVGAMCIGKMKDTDASVRDAASSVLIAMLGHPDEPIQEAALSSAKELEQSNPRAFKTLLSASGTTSKPVRPPLASQGSLKSRVSLLKKQGSRTESAPTSPRSNSTRRSNLPQGLKTSPQRKSNLPQSFNSSSQRKNAAPAKAARKAPSSKKTSTDAEFSVDVDESDIPLLEVSSEYMSSLGIPDWETEDENGDLVAGLQSGNWKSRKAAIEALIEFTTSAKAKTDGERFAANALVLVKNNTKQFKDSNFNILKAICQLFMAVCDLYQSLDRPLEPWMCKDATTICVAKIADKKFSQLAPPLLSRLCEVQLPQNVLHFSIVDVGTIISPAPHEGLLVWAETFCREFGGHAIGGVLKSFIVWVSKVRLHFLLLRCHFDVKYTHLLLPILSVE